MIPDFPYNIRIRLAQLKIYFLAGTGILILLCLCPVSCLSLEKFSWDSQQGRQSQSNVRKQQSYSYEESLVSPNLNSNLLMFHWAHPIMYIPTSYFSYLWAKIIIWKRAGRKNWFMQRFTWWFDRKSFREFCQCNCLKSVLYQIFRVCYACGEECYQLCIGMLFIPECECQFMKK